jgi:hypothetical protein
MQQLKKWLLALLIALQAAAIGAREKKDAPPPEKVETTHYQLVLNWSDVDSPTDKTLGGRKLVWHLYRKSDWKELIKEEGEAPGLQEVFINGVRSRMYEYQYMDTDYVIFCLNSFLGWRGTCFVIAVKGEGEKVMCKARVITIFYETVCIQGGLFARCAGWEAPDMTKQTDQPMAIVADMRDMSLDQIVWQGQLKNACGKVMTRPDDDDSVADKRYMPYRKALSRALCAKLAELLKERGAHLAF